MEKNKKTAVILFNLGGPDRPESIRPFLINFFMDKNIIRAPIFVRFFIARLIAHRRTKKEAGASYGALGGKSPLLANTQAQANALQVALGDEYNVHVCMRYWHPMAEEIIQKIKNENPDNIILLPLYPQYSTTTTRSSFQHWFKAAKKHGLNIPTKAICCYPEGNGFIKASADNIRTALNAFKEKYHHTPRLLFSAHGLPEKIIAGGDPYQWACEESARLIANELKDVISDWEICYQSRVGPLKWIGPSTEEALQKAAHDKASVLIYPHAFVSEHVETLVEIEEEYRHLAKELGITAFERVPTVSCHPLFIDGLAEMVRNAGSTDNSSALVSPRICPQKFGECCQNEYNSMHQ